LVRKGINPLPAPINTIFGISVDPQAHSSEPTAW